MSADDQVELEARDAIFREITRVAGELDSHKNVLTESAVIRDLALAYRLAAGGPPPGGSLIAK